MDNDETFEVQAFTVLDEHYSGVEDGESWSEGGHSNYAMLSSMPGGKYTLRVEVHGEPHKNPTSLRVIVHQGVPRWLHVFWLFFFLSVVPGAVGLYHLNFEYRRWQDSPFSPFQSS
jgi:hypothetical protein